ncbi:MAG: Crp/Fnr family transcriptional regulator [Clostridiaceae bacterium]|nr:Crp/Fnr family transcriptional regulator [Clostridiaceae bacterium]
MFREWLPVLVQCPLFRGLSQEKIEALMPCFTATVRSCGKGDILRAAGQMQTAIGLVLAGEVHIQQEDFSGNRLIIGVFSPGELFGEVSAFAGLGRWPNTVLASKDSHILFIPIEKISRPCSRVCDAHQTLIRNMLEIVAGKAIFMNNRISYLKRKSMREKLAAYLYDLYCQQDSEHLNLPLNRENLADYLNVSRSSMSREMGRMRNEGLIDFHRSSLVIKNIPAMCRLNMASLGEP